MPEKSARRRPAAARTADGARSPRGQKETTPKRPGRLSRAEKNRRTREAIFDAAAKVVGEEGYLGAMVAMITARAEVAQGTFYNYFESRQDLFDQLLPALGREMLDEIQAASAGAATEEAREEAGFRAFFAFLRRRPEFYRILYEAEVFAPKAFRQHWEIVRKGYTRVLQRARERGELRPLDDREIEAIAVVLTGARQYLCMQYGRKDGDNVALPEWVVTAYMKLFRGLLAGKAG